MNNRYQGEHIVLSDHARSYIPIRGYEPDEVEQTIREAGWQPTERNRSTRARISRSTKSGMASFMERNKSDPSL
jgi:hypothetical protein